ncbi:MAG: class I SAM-dependent methyltransferase, partial [Acetobacterales bacterium]
MNTKLARQVAKAIVPRRHRFAVRSAALRIFHHGDQRFCGCCGSWVKRFGSFGPGVPRENAQCPVCGALERDRLVARYFASHPGLLRSARHVLHVSPERAIAQLLVRSAADYVSIDIEPGLADRVMDLTDVRFGDASFDAVYCSNVLEHIADDRKAMDEIFRVLAPGGWAVVLVPLYGDDTHEDFDITDSAERTRFYGQPDHVRAYGVDIAERLAGRGFDVWVEQPALGISAEEALSRGLPPHEIIFLCRRPAGGGGGGGG